MKLQNVLLILTMVFGTSLQAAPAVTGTYSLPFNDELKDVSNFDLPVNVFRVDGHFFIVDYTLPADLIGRETETMTMFTEENPETTPFFHLVCSRTDSEAYCTKQNNKLVCAVKFRNLAIDRVQVEAHLTGKYGASELTTKRINASRNFASDAVGALNFNFEQWPTDETPGG